MPAQMVVQEPELSGGGPELAPRESDGFFPVLGLPRPRLWPVPLHVPCH